MLSSDKLSGLRRPIILLKLDILQNDGSTKERLIELSADDAGELIEKLKSAQSVCTAAVIKGT